MSMIIRVNRKASKFSEKPFRFFYGIISDALRDLLPFVQFKKREKYPWRRVTFSKACNFTKSNIPPWEFFMFF